MTTRRTLAIAAFSAAASLFAAISPAQAAPADDQMHDTLEQYRSVATRGQWINPYLPEATGLASAAPSGDEQLERIVAGYTRSQLDRGGWANAWVPHDGYAAGEPLLAVRIGEGVTSRVAAVTTAPDRQLASVLR